MRLGRPTAGYEGFKADFLDGHDWWSVHIKDLAAVTAEEVEAFKLAEMRKKLKVGDIVRYAGQLEVVNEVKPTHRKSTGEQFLSQEKGLTLGEHEYWAYIESVELVAPVETRFDARC